MRKRRIVWEKVVPAEFTGCFVRESSQKRIDGCSFCVAHVDQLCRKTFVSDACMIFKRLARWNIGYSIVCFLNSTIDSSSIDPPAL